MLVFFILRWANIDPHNAKDSTGLFKPFLNSLLITIAFVLLLYLQTNQKLITFLSSYVIYSIYMPVINPPVHWRKDEYPNKFKAFLESKKQQFGGVYWLKLFCLFLALIFVGNISSYWLLVFVVFGVILQIGKSLTLNLLIQADAGEWKNIQGKTQQDHIMKVYGGWMLTGVLAFVIFSFYFGLRIVSYAELTPKNWSSYSSILGGFLFGIFSETLFDLKSA